MSGDSVSSLDAVDLRLTKLRRVSAKRRSDRVDNDNWAERCFMSSEDETEDLEYLRSIENGRPLKDRSSEKVSKPKVQGEEYETDTAVLKRRQKQIDYGKNTKGYNKYLEMIPKSKRRAKDIWTPNKYIKYSRRSWDGQVRRWRKALHRFDPEESSDSDGCKEREKRVKAVMAFLQPLMRKPDSNEPVQEPNEDESSQESDEDESTQGSNEDESTQKPNEEESTQGSNEDESMQKPNEEESTQEPDGDDSAQEPDGDDSAQERIIDELLGDSDEDEFTCVSDEDELACESDGDELMEEFKDGEQTGNLDGDELMQVYENEQLAVAGTSSSTST